MVVVAQDTRFNTLSASSCRRTKAELNQSLGETLDLALPLPLVAPTLERVWSWVAVLVQYRVLAPPPFRSFVLL